MRAFLTASRSPAILTLAGRSCDNWLDGLLTLTSLPLPAKKAIAVAAEISVPAIVKRKVETKRFCLNECEVFILIGADELNCVGVEIAKLRVRGSSTLILHFCNAEQRVLATRFNLSSLAVLLQEIRSA